jgi:uncharacterized protein YutE (UPF0331/DUF86 family)
MCSWRRFVQNNDRVSKGISDILDAKAEMERILSAGKEAFLSDRKNSLALKYLLIQAVEAITDVCQHQLAKTKGVVCSGYVDCIVKAGENGVIRSELATKLRRLADLRNSLVHRYWTINDGDLFDQCRANISDFSDFSSQVSNG